MNLSISRARSCGLLLLAVACFLAGCSGTPVSDEEFLKKVHERQQTAPSDSSAALAPPITEGNAALPKIEVGADSLDLGIIPNNDFGRGELRIANVGKGPLVVRDIQTSCACTQGHLDEAQKTIAPGAEVMMKVTVDPNRVHGFHSRKTLSIISNDPNRGAVEVKVLASVDPEFAVIPDTYDFGAINRENVNEFKVIVRQIIDTPLVIEKVLPFDPANPEIPPGDLIVTHTRLPEDQWTTPGKAEYEVHVKLAPDAPIGKFVHQFNIFTNVPRVRVLRFTTEGTLSTFYAIDPDPAKPLLVRDMGGAPNQPPSVLKIRSDRAFTLENMNFDAALLQVAPQFNPENTVAELTVSLLPEAPPGRSTATLDFDIVAGDLRQTQHISITTLKVEPKPAAN